MRLGIDPDHIDDHAFYPRLALGEYFVEKLHGLIDHGRANGIAIEVATRCCIADIETTDAGLQLQVRPTVGLPYARTFDFVVLATGHQWPDEPEVKPGYFLSPWPASALKRIPPIKVAIRGSSLTAIDAAVALATSHGVFTETEGAEINYRAGPGSEAFRIVMMSRKGLLPEADFYHPLPYERLAICTPEAVQALIAQEPDAVLERAYGLFKQELQAADPAYAEQVGLADIALDDFADRYFEQRISVDRFTWAVSNLAKAKANFREEVTVSWRYAILRMHEVLALIVPYLDPDDLERFNRSLKPVFVDEYATVPHLSIERLLALHRAGRLEVVALGSDYRVDTGGPGPGARIIIGGEGRRFPVLIEATGQRALAADAFPFPTLVEDGVVCDARAEDPESPKGIAVDDLFHPVSDHPAARQVYCLSIPFILSRHPFIQGITSSYDMGEVVGADLAARLGTYADAALSPERV